MRRQRVVMYVGENGRCPVKVQDYLCLSKELYFQASALGTTVAWRLLGSQSRPPLQVGSYMYITHMKDAVYMRLYGIGIRTQRHYQTLCLSQGNRVSRYDTTQSLIPSEFDTFGPFISCKVGTPALQIGTTLRG